MLYYGEYSNGRRYVRAYDEEKHGALRFVGKSAFLYHGSIIVSKENIFNTEKALLRHGENILRSPLSCLTAARLPRRSTSGMILPLMFLYRGIWYAGSYGRASIKPP